MTVAVGNRCLQAVAMATSTAGAERSTVQPTQTIAAPPVEHRLKLAPIPSDRLQTAGSPVAVGTFKLLSVFL